MTKIITLTTDYGTKDGYAGAVKGVILSINPEARIIDISHEIPAQDIMAGAFCLQNACGYFPRGTIHLGVVDPGVGGTRKGILIQTDNYFFVGPDNGLFSLALAREEVKAIIQLKNRQYFLSEISSTFHGRDIFAPVAAYLSRGVNPSEFGPRLNRFTELKIPRVKFSKNKIIGEIIHIDNFGNLVSNVTQSELSHNQVKAVKVKERKIPRISKTFSAVKKGQLVAYIGSYGHLEIGVNQGNAALILKAGIGTPLDIII